jgi:hypothetical protein
MRKFFKNLLPSKYLLPSKLNSQKKKKPNPSNNKRNPNLPSNKLLKKMMMKRKNPMMLMIS